MVTRLIVAKFLFKARFNERFEFRFALFLRRLLELSQAFLFNAYEDVSVVVVVLIVVAA